MLEAAVLQYKLPSQPVYLTVFSSPTTEHETTVQSKTQGAFESRDIVSLPFSKLTPVIKV